MNWTQVADNYWVSPQIDEHQVVAAKEQGFSVIMCNRPDGEDAGQPTSASIQSIAEENGLEFVFLPMQGPQFEADYIAKVQQLNQDGKKVLAYCRSGNRSSMLFNAAAG